MYNRYVPSADGTYQKHSVPDGPPPKPMEPPPPKPPSEPPKRPKPPDCPKPIGSFLEHLLPEGLDTEDLIVVLLLLLMSGDSQGGSNTALITLLIYLFL